jgi:hypothetical protein
MKFTNTVFWKDFLKIDSELRVIIASVEITHLGATDIDVEVEGRQSTCAYLSATHLGARIGATNLCAEIVDSALLAIDGDCMQSMSDECSRW